MHPKRLLVTGGAGFIGSAFIRRKMKYVEHLVNFDALTYAASEEALLEVQADPCYHFVQGDVCDQKGIEEILVQHHIDTIVHFAAESHVDNSIEDPMPFYRTNIGGTIALLEAVRKYKHVHFHHISTDEVFGSLGAQGAFCETSPYQPNSPYSASKASSDHFVGAYAGTYDISATLSYCSNNYGPYQHREKMIPHMIACMLEDKPLPIYGNGRHVRDWLYVDDHVDALWGILTLGERSSTYAIGGGTEITNLELVHCLIEEVASQAELNKERLIDRIEFVKDRAGHDFRYAIDASKVQHALGWYPKVSFAEGIRRTVASFIAHCAGSRHV